MLSLRYPVADLTRLVDILLRDWQSAGARAVEVELDPERAGRTFRE